MTGRSTDDAPTLALNGRLYRSFCEHNSIGIGIGKNRILFRVKPLCYRKIVCSECGGDLCHLEGFQNEIVEACDGLFEGAGCAHGEQKRGGRRDAAKFSGESHTGEAGHLHIGKDEAEGGGAYLRLMDLGERGLTGVSRLDDVARTLEQQAD